MSSSQKGNLQCENDVTLGFFHKHCALIGVTKHIEEKTEGCTINKHLQISQAAVKTVCGC